MTKARTKEKKVNNVVNSVRRAQIDGRRKAMMRRSEENEESEGSVRNLKPGRSNRGESVIGMSFVMTAIGSILEGIITGTVLHGAMRRMTFVLMMMAGLKYHIGVSVNMTVKQ